MPSLDHRTMAVSDARLGISSLTADPTGISMPRVYQNRVLVHNSQLLQLPPRGSRKDRYPPSKSEDREIIAAG